MWAFISSHRGRFVLRSAAATALIAGAIVAVVKAPDERANRLYADTSPLNQRIASNAETDPASSTMIELLLTEVGANGWPIAAGEFTNTIYYADASTPRYDVALSAPSYSGQRLQDVPIPDDATVPSDSDGGLVVIDRDTGCEYDFARARKEKDGTWSALFANALPIDGDGIYPSAESPSASGFASASGTILPEELDSGQIDHALVFTMQNTKVGGPVAPAVGSDGHSTAEGAIPEGARLQLDPSLELDRLRLTSWQKGIARALQEYGMYLVDTGGAVALRVQHSASTSSRYPWGEALYGQMPPELAKHLRVLDLGPQVEPVYDFVNNDCARLG